MKKKDLTRRSFLHASTVVAGSLTAGSLLTRDGRAAQPKASGIYICTVCGHIEFGGMPDTCPVCHAPRDKFKQDDAVFTEAAARYKEGAGKHIPVIQVKSSALITEEPCKEVAVRIGKPLHAQTEAHHIAFLDCYVDNKYIGRADLTPGILPAATFYLKAGGSKVKVVEFCNLHSYWQAEADLQ